MDVLSLVIGLVGGLVVGAGVGIVIRKVIAEKNPADIRVASLFVKPDNLQVELDIHYRCFDIANDFIVGYGLDYDQQGRNLPDIYRICE